MQIYMVGGAVRDRLLGRPVNDHDWVVVGATPEQMLELGYLPVGRDFPVFLHPETREEYALARTERKSGRGYRGFVVESSPNVTLEEDLSRRDLTINSIASSADSTGATVLFDPYHGVQDLQARLLRHVTDSFREDPVRILRVARFAARFTDFTVAPETMQLMREMVEHGEVDHLVPERVWQELARGLMEAKPSRMFEVLRECGALQVLLPEVARLWGVPQPPLHHPEVDTGVHLMMVLDMAARLNAPLVVRFACLAHDFGKGTTPQHVLPRHIGHEERSAKLLRGVAERLRVPVDCRETADVVAREHGNIHRSGDLSAAALVRLLERCDAIRKPERFADVLLACECDARGRLGFEEAAYPQRPRLLGVLAAVQSVVTRDIAAHAAAHGLVGPQVGQLIHQARIEAVAQWLHSGASPSPQNPTGPRSQADARGRQPPAISLRLAASHHRAHPAHDVCRPQSARNARHLAPLLEQDHGRNAADGIARRDGLVVFGVELGQAHAGFQLAGGLRKGGRHLSAGATTGPRSPPAPGCGCAPHACQNWSHPAPAAPPQTGADGIGRNRARCPGRRSAGGWWCGNGGRRCAGLRSWRGKG